MDFLTTAGNDNVGMRAALIVSAVALSACSQPVVTEVQTITIKRPHVTQCKRIGIGVCKPGTNGQLLECLLETTRYLDLCADQTDALVKWQEGNDGIK